jgi:hypothetical protein
MTLQEISSKAQTLFQPICSKIQIDKLATIASTSKSISILNSQKLRTDLSEQMSKIQRIHVLKKNAKK